MSIKTAILTGVVLGATGGTGAYQYLNGVDRELRAETSSLEVPASSCGLDSEAACASLAEASQPETKTEAEPLTLSPGVITVTEPSFHTSVEVETEMCQQSCEELPVQPAVDPVPPHRSNTVIKTPTTAPLEGAVNGN